MVNLTQVTLGEEKERKEKKKTLDFKITETKWESSISDSHLFKRVKAAEAETISRCKENSKFLIM